MNQKSSFFSRKHHSTVLLSVMVLFVFTECSSVKQLAVEQDATRLLRQSEIFSNQFTGFSLFDLESNAYIAGHNATLRFTPASNTKLLTMYVALRSFSDSIPAFLVQHKSNHTLLTPLGDPSFLYNAFPHQGSFEFLSQQDSIVISWPNEDPEPFGPGWAWDDFRYDFQSQRCWWPIFGNTVEIEMQEDELDVTPSFFKEYVEVLSSDNAKDLVDRAPKFNLFKAYPDEKTSGFQQAIPFEYSKELLVKLLSDTLKMSIGINSTPLINQDTLFSQHIDTVLQKMMKPSDNLISEQLLMMAAKWNGYEAIDPFIDFVKTTWLASLTEMVWVDGSGLSRYNLIAPVDQVRLLKKCHDEFGWDRITTLLPSGGEGTLEELYLTEEDESPFLFAKTGTLSNNHNLSGFLITKSGKKMIFSFMNNHYTRPTAEVKKAMEAFLLNIRDAY